MARCMELERFGTEHEPSKAPELTAAAQSHDKDLDLVIGRQNFGWKRLNILQIGLGTFFTFVDNLTNPSAASPWLCDLLGPCHSNQLFGVGVEPVSKHVERLRPRIQQLENTTLVRAVVGKEKKIVDVYEIASERHLEALDMLEPSVKEACEEAISYLDNMSSVGQPHPAFADKCKHIKDHYNVSVELRQVQAMSFSYDDLSRLLRFSGTDVLVIDAEGEDCQILASMIAHCMGEGNSEAWPDTIQFETMETNSGREDRFDEEDRMLEELERHGYLVVCLGKDAVLVRRAALAPQRQPWVGSLYCGMCGKVGILGVPFHWQKDKSCYMCTHCHNSLSEKFRRAAWKWVKLQHDNYIWSLATNGTSVWCLDYTGTVYEYKEDAWQPFVDSLKLLSLCCDGGLELWGADPNGSLMHRSVEEGSQWILAVECNVQVKRISAARDGTSVWCIDEEGGVCVWVPGKEEFYPREGSNFEHISVSAHGTHIWGTDTFGGVFYRCGLSGNWENCWGTLRRIAVSGDGCHVWGINYDGCVYYNNKSGPCGNWVYQGNSSRELGEDLCVSQDGSMVWGVDRRGYFWSVPA